MQEKADTAVKKGFQALNDEVIGKGLCMICGACAGVCPTQAIKMQMSDYSSGDPVPTLVGKCTECDICNEVCAGKHVQLRDTDVHTFGRERKTLEEPLGIYRRTMKGYANGRARESSSSGGITMGIVNYALAEGLIEPPSLRSMIRSIPGG